MQHHWSRVWPTSKLQSALHMAKKGACHTDTTCSSRGVVSDISDKTELPKRTQIDPIQFLKLSYESWILWMIQEQGRIPSYIAVEKDTYPYPPRPPK